MAKKLKNSEKEIIEHLNDRYWRLNNLYWVMDEGGQKVLFRFNRVQDILYRSLWWLNIVPKSRQHGITTFICIFFLDACLFNENVRAAIICHRLEAAKKIFRDKIKYAYKHLPEFIRLMVPVVDSNGKPLNISKSGKSDEMIFLNNSSIYVDTSIRSGTAQYLHISEYDYVCKHAPERADEIKRGGLDAIHEGTIAFVESTSEGSETDFKSMCRNAGTDDEKLTRLDFKRHFFGWHEDPKNRLKGFDGEIPKELDEYFDSLELILDKTLDLEQRGWYMKKKSVHGFNIYKEQPSTFEEAFTAASEGAYFGSEMSYVRENDMIGFVPYDPNVKVFTFWDTGNMYTSICFFQFKGERINAIDHYFDDLGQGLPHYATVLQNKGYVYGGHFAGPDIDPSHGSNNKSFQTGEKTVDIARRLGIVFHIIESHSFDNRITCTKDMIKRTWFSKEKCASLVLGLTNFRRRKNNQLSTKERPVFFEEPVRDTIDIHIADSYGHMAVWYSVKLVKGESIGVKEPERTKYHIRTEQPRNIILRGFHSERRKVV